MTVAACGTTGGSTKGTIAAGLELPELKPELRIVPPAPDVRDGEPELAALNRIGKDLQICRGHLSGVIRYVDDVAELFERPGEEL